jgi:hypothetical protein
MCVGFMSLTASANGWLVFGGGARLRPVVKVRFPRAVGGDSKTPGAVPRELGPTDFISKEVDPILEKISAQGLHSLTEREKKILEAARAKIEKH